MAEEENLPSANILNAHCSNSGYCSDPRDSDEATSSQQEARQKNDEEMASIAGANYTNDASLKQPHTLMTVDSAEIGGVRV